MSDQVIKPDFVDDETLEDYLDYLDWLRASGETNMFGAMLFLMVEYPELEEEQASKVLFYWMKTFSERHQKAGDSNENS